MTTKFATDDQQTIACSEIQRTFQTAFCQSKLVRISLILNVLFFFPVLIFGSHSHQFYMLYLLICRLLATENDD